MSNRSIRARLVAATLALLLSSAPAAAYVLPVTDVLNWLRNQATAIQTALQNDVLDTKYQVVQKMARRLSESVGDLRRRFGVGHDDPPRWRIHDFESDRYPYGRVYGAALNYGDSAGTAVDIISRTAPTLTDLPPTLSPTARRDISRALATLDIADAVLRSGTHQAGLLRYGGRSLYAAAAAYELDALDGDIEQSTTAVLDKLNASAILELKQKQGRNDLLTTALEVALLDTKRRRDTETVAMNQRFRTALHYRRYAATFFPPESAALVDGWRQP